MVENTIQLSITPKIEALVDEALSEDLGDGGDVTTQGVIPADLHGAAIVATRASGILAGIDVALFVFRRFDPTLRTCRLFADGSELKYRDAGCGEGGEVVAKIQGKVASILKAERTAINFLQHLSGVATETRRYIEELDGLDVQLLDTRKTIPGHRVLDKYAVRVGGGINHRMGLGDGILVKDNHIQIMERAGSGLREVVEEVRANAPPGLQVEVEVEDLQQVEDALEARADILLLDNMALDEMAEAVVRVRGRALTEASGGISLGNVRAVAETGVDMISVGALTHSARALDFSLEIA